ncbi:22579_t:CDS:2, partial [Gigaspora rosea]
MQNLFKDVPEANKEGTKQILVCYKSGRLYFEAIFKQDILKTEPCITYGHVIYEEITHSELLDSEFLFSIQISNTENHKVQ